MPFKLARPLKERPILIEESREFIRELSTDRLGYGPFFLTFLVICSRIERTSDKGFKGGTNEHFACRIR